VTTLRKTELIPLLHDVQKKDGYLCQENLKNVAESLSLAPSFVKGVATFYSMFRHKPNGRNIIQLCTNIACMILGAERLVDILKDKYGLEPGGTTADGRFSLVIMECIGACATAPAMLVNDDLHENLTEENIITILESYK
jgi:NADH-quinone oxidoreductase E subunit